MIAKRPPFLWRVPFFGAVLLAASTAAAGSFADNFDVGTGSLDASPSWTTRAFGNSGVDMLYEAGGNGGQRIDLPAGPLCISTADAVVWNNGDDFSLRTQVYMAADTVWAGLIFGWSDNSNFYVFEINDGTGGGDGADVRVKRRINGTETNLVLQDDASPRFLRLRWYELKVDYTAGTQQFALTVTDTTTNAVVYTGAFTDGSFTSGSMGLIGEGSSQSKFDNFSLTTTPSVPVPPTISTGLTSKTAWVGESLVLQVAAAGGNPSYSWTRNGEPIANATGSTLTLDDLTIAAAGTYQVTVTNPQGSVSSSAVITVIFPTRRQVSDEPLSVSSRRTSMVISELHYNPAGGPTAPNLEFIEFFNTAPWSEDLSGWRLTGEVEFTFPASTIIPARGYLVVAADPAALQAASGLANVTGPWLGALDNSGGTVRLRKPSGAVVLEVPYDDEGGWPLAADGAGHSLVLARPSYGESSPIGWEPSRLPGGSPGSVETSPATLLDHVCLSRLLVASTAADARIELKNRSPFTIDVSGCYLADSSTLTSHAALPAGSILSPNGTLLVSPAFALPAAGFTVHLIAPDGLRIIDSVSSRVAVAGSWLRRDFDAWHRRLFPETLLMASGQPEIVINEIFFHPPEVIDGSPLSEWVEIFNRTSQSLDISGWKFTEGIDYTFPATTHLPAGDYLVIARDRLQFLQDNPSATARLAPGNFSGSLDDGGESLTLSQPTGAGFVHVDSVRYEDQTRRREWADGGGSSLEKTHPAAVGAYADAWADSDESTKAAWTILDVTDTPAHTNTATSLNPTPQAQFFLLNSGRCEVDDVEVLANGGPNLVTNSNFASGLIGWTADGSHYASFWQDGTARLVADSQGDGNPNRLRITLSTAVPTTAGTSITLRAKARWQAGHPEFCLRLQGGAAESVIRLPIPRALGTPGFQNSRFSAATPPQISEVRHFPLLPQANAAFRVFARVQDPDGLGAVRCSYRVDPATTWTEAVMTDDGLNGDMLASDGIFTAKIGAMAAGSLVAFRVLADDTAVPVGTSQFPPGEALVRIGEPAAGNSFDTVRMYLTQSTIAEWTGTQFRANRTFPVTILHGSRSIYDARASYRGNKDSHDSPVGALVGYGVSFPPDEPVLGANALALDWPIRDVTNQREQLQYWFLDQLRLPSLHRRDVHFFINGARRGVIYHDAERPDGDLMDSHFPQGGQLFKLTNDDECNASGARISPFRRSQLQRYEKNGALHVPRYRWVFRPRASGSSTLNDYSALFGLVDACSAHPADAAAYVQGLRKTVDMDNWLRTFAFCDLGSFWDAFGNSNYKNSFLARPNGGGWTIFTWDCDVGLGVQSDPVDLPLFNVDDDAVERINQTPEFLRTYYRALQEATGSFFSIAGVTPRLTMRHNAYIAAGISVTSPFVASGSPSKPVTQWIDERRTFLLSELTRLGASGGNFTVTDPANASSTPDAAITLRGTAPIGVASITINGLSTVPIWTALQTWEIPFVLRPGIQNLTIHALDSTGAVLATENRTLTYTGVPNWPALRINEWAASNGTGGFADPADGNFDDWLELYNPTASAINLANWTLTDNAAIPNKFILPTGSLIPASGYLLIWADDQPEQTNFILRPDIHSSFSLSASGESILLFAPDGTRIDGVTFGPQARNFTSARTGPGDEDNDLLAEVTPGAANSPIASIGVLTMTASNITLSQAWPRFAYQLESSSDLTHWEPLGVPLTVSSAGDLQFPSLEILPAVPIRFVRAIRMP